jgi:hypothetical protein
MAITLASVTPNQVQTLFANRSPELHKKVDATRDAYFGFIFPITVSDLLSVSDALGIDGPTARELYRQGRHFSTFRESSGARPHLTNHIVGTSLLALRGQSLDTGLSSVTDQSLSNLAEEHFGTILEIAEIRAPWFGRIYFPAQAFSNALHVFGGTASPDSLFSEADARGFAANAASRKTIRGDFGIALWLTMLGKAP